MDLSLEEVIKKKASEGRSGRISFNLDRSLDDIIRERKAGLDETKKRRNEDSMDVENNVDIDGPVMMGSFKKKKRLDNAEYYVPDPLEVVGKLTEDGMVIEHEIGRQSGDEDGRNHNWRAKFICGDLIVTCDSARKILAKQGGALELIKQMRECEPETDFPRCEIPEYCFYDKIVCQRLDEVATSMGLGTPDFVMTQSRKDNRDFYTTTYKIGEDEFTGSSFDMDGSQVIAAKSAYETYAGKKFPRDTFLRGDNCIPNKEYECQESGTTQVIAVDCDAIQKY